MRQQRVLLLGAAGRDFHNFNQVYRENTEAKVVAFTATQIPNIEKRHYPAELAGPLYPEGIPILEESKLEQIIAEQDITDVVFSYSDVPHREVMHLASRSLAAGANFVLLGLDATLLTSSRPVIGVLGTRTGVGKSQVSRFIARELREQGLSVIVLRHPMPYSQDLRMQRVERFANMEDLEHFECTIEEREEYEPYIELGLVVYAGVDYGAILKQAEQEADIILWDGGNNDLPFVKPDLWITVADPLRQGHELSYHPGEANLRAADVVLINKANTATPDSIAALQQTIALHNPNAQTVVANSAVFAESPEAIRGKRVLCIDDGPTLTHGEMGYGAGYVAAQRYGAAEVLDPRPFAQGSLRDVFAKHSHIQNTLPAMGYFPEQLEDLAATIRNTPCDVVLVATPIDLAQLIDFPQEHVRVRYNLEDRDPPYLAEFLQRFVEQHQLK
ncbi:MAG: GTPase [Deltaproteobacteria bacterium]|nr:MAG: GTPase [Deltaproteobacteria bacterium]